jgi:hypothetical protein
MVGLRKEEQHSTPETQPTVGGKQGGSNDCLACPEERQGNEERQQGPWVHQPSQDRGAANDPKKRAEDGYGAAAISDVKGKQTNYEGSPDQKQSTQIPQREGSPPGQNQGCSRQRHSQHMKPATSGAMKSGDRPKEKDASQEADPGYHKPMAQVKNRPS